MSLGLRAVSLPFWVRNFLGFQLVALSLPIWCEQAGGAGGAAGDPQGGQRPQEAAGRRKKRSQEVRLHFYPCSADSMITLTDSF